MALGIGIACSVLVLFLQIVTKEGESLGFGILEYESAEDAERSFNKFNKHKINNIPMNISYCIPGKSAIHMFNRIMFKYVSVSSGFHNIPLTK